MRDDAEKPTPFVTTVDITIANKLRQDLENQGFDISTPAYTIFAAKKKGVSCTLYQSGKLTVQGKESPAFLEFYLEPEILGSFDTTYPELQLNQTARIGIDESGKGDFFGPLCIAGVYAAGEGVLKLKKMGVKDSKTLTDASILKIAAKIRANCVHHIVRINPLKYNELYLQFKNLNLLLAWGHATTIEQLVLKTGCSTVHIDQFAAKSVVINALKRKKLNVDLSQKHRGEEDLVVAAASILAREAFLNGLRELGEQFGVTLPKGASSKTIEIGKELVRKMGPEVLNNVGKLHFKTIDSILKL